MTRNSFIRIAALVAVFATLAAVAVMAGRTDEQTVVSSIAAKANQSKPDVEHRQLVRVWVHGEDIYPPVVYVRPGKVLLRLENETQSDVALVVERVDTGRPPENLTRLNATQKGKRADKETTLGAGEYVFYEETQPDFKGRIFVEPKQ